jgi:hypothetical protein
LHPKITSGGALLKDISSSASAKWQCENGVEHQFLNNCCLKFEIQNRQQIASNENRFSMGFKGIEKICNRHRAMVVTFSQVDVEQILSNHCAQFKSEVLSTRHRNVHRCSNMALMFSGHLLSVSINNHIQSSLQDISSR